MNRGAPPRIGAIEGLRGIAVSLVFAVHFTGMYAAAYRGLDLGNVPDALALAPSQLLLYWLFYSHHGVYIFFAISGFVISRSFAPKRGLRDYAVYLGYRVARIYPAFLVSLAAGVLLAIANEGRDAFDVRTLLQNLVFLNGAFGLHVRAYNFVTWSLYFEFIFYIAFPLLYVVAVASGRARATAPWLWLAFVAALALASFREWMLMLPFLCGAIAGLQSGERLERIAERVPDAALILLYATITTTACLFVPLPRLTSDGFVWPTASAWYIGGLSVVAALAVVNAGFGRGVLHRALTSRPVLALGRVSFSFFLLHAIVLQVAFATIAPKIGNAPIAGATLAVATFGLAWLAAAASYEIAERPYYRLKRNDSAAAVEQRVAF